MSRQRIHLDDLLSGKVLDRDGRVAGRIEEIVADDKGDYCEVREYLLGRRALLSRLSIASLSSGVVRLLGGRTLRASHRVPWNQLDLSNPRHPRLRCRADELETIQSNPEPRRHSSEH